MSSNYEKHPYKTIPGYQAYEGYADILAQIQKQRKDSMILTLDFYHGTNTDQVYKELIEPLCPDTIIHSEQAKKSEGEITALLKNNLTDDRVFGVLSTATIDQLFDSDKIQELKTKIQPGLTVIYGVGASLIHPGDLSLFFDLTRWEIQCRYRAGLDNWGAKNYGEDILTKYKRGYFVEWRIFDRYKWDCLKHCAWYVETNNQEPKMISMEAYHAGLRQFSQEPFRLVPYFDQGIWGGTWMKKVCDLPESKTNYAWCFDGVPEENSICFKFDDILVDVPAINLVHEQTDALLGKRIHARFGKEFPIRFDFLDTMEGGNLSLQVHPLTEYIQENFGMHYTQDESYYILDATEDAHVYLGVKNGVELEPLIEAFQTAQDTQRAFDDETYINKIPVKKHDHALIPAGTIHCSGAGTMVLEISATPYIFTFKLYDWGRVGLDGNPRPINIARGKENIQIDRNTDWVYENCIHREKTIYQDKDLTIERTGLHELEFIETLRYSFTSEMHRTMNDCFDMINLVEGQKVEIYSPKNAFQPFTLHYVETCILPASLKEYSIRTKSPAKIICASVR